MQTAASSDLVSTGLLTLPPFQSPAPNRRTLRNRESFKKHQAELDAATGPTQDIRPFTPPSQEASVKDEQPANAVVQPANSGFSRQQIDDMLYEFGLGPDGGLPGSVPQSTPQQPVVYAPVIGLPPQSQPQAQPAQNQPPVELKSASCWSKRPCCKP